MDRKKLYFYEDDHKYFDDDKKEYISVTTLIKRYEPQFDKRKEARNIARRGQGMYKGKNMYEVEKMWNNMTIKANERGNEKHNFLENGIKEFNNFKASFKTAIFRNDEHRLYTIDNIMTDHDYGTLDIEKFKELVKPRYPKIVEAVEYYANKGYRAYPELGIYNSDYYVSGLIDLPMINFDTGLFVIIDWKTNKHNIVFESGYYKKDKALQYTDKWVKTHKHFLAPLESLEYCLGNKYTLQTSTYARLLEYFGLTCEGIIICHIKHEFKLNRYGMPYRDNTGDFVPLLDKPEIVKFHWVPYMKNAVDIMINHYYNKTIGTYGDNYTLKFK